jgi:hypothetical protein
VAAIKHPARHFVVYLLSKRIYDAKTVLRMMTDLGLPVPQEDYELGFEHLVTDILGTRAAMTFPENFRPRDAKLNDETLQWLRKWKIHDMWRRSPYVAAATDLLSEPQIRHLLELLLLGPLTASSIAERLIERFDLPPHVMNPSVVKAYAHYYWDPNAMNSAQWRQFLERHHKDSRNEYLAALSAPRSAAGAAFVIAIADKDPQLLSAAERYETASTMAFGMMMHHSLAGDGSTGHTYAAFTALNMMRMADEELSKHRGGSSDLLEELQRMRPIYDKQPTLQITQATYIQRPALEASTQEVIDVPDK